MPAPKRKNNISPRTKKEVAALSKFRKSDKRALLTGNVEEFEDSGEDMELSLKSKKSHLHRRLH